MTVQHVFSNTVPNWTGTVTVFNSQGSTATAAATDLVRPQDWNSAHQQAVTLSGNTNNSSAVSGTNIVWSGGNNITLVGSTAAGVATIGISGPHTSQFLTTAALSNHSHGNPTLALTNLSGTTASASDGFTLSLSAAAPGGGGGGGVTHTLYIPHYPALMAAQTLGGAGATTGSAFFWPISVREPVAINRIEQLMAANYVTSSVAGSQTVSHLFGLYSNNNGTLSNITSGSYSLAVSNSSVSATASIPTSYGTAGGYGYGTVSATATSALQLLLGTAGSRIMTFGLGGELTLTHGLYWVGLMQRQSTVGAGLGVIPSIAGNAMAAAQNIGPLGFSTAAFTSGTAASFKSGWGVHSSTGSAGYGGTALPLSVPISALAQTMTFIPLQTLVSR